MIQTTNYKLNKIELADSPADITVLNGNWDTIDTNLKKLSDEKFDKKGGTVSGTVTITGKLIASGGAELNGNVTFNDPIIGKTSFLATVDAVKGTAPSAQKSFHIGFYDKNGFGIPANRLARIQYTLGTDNNPQMSMLVNRPNEGSTEDPVGVIAQWIGNTSARISVTHHPSTDSNDKSVATTYWVRNLKATASQYGLVKLADETALLNESDESALTVDKAYELNDFRRMETAYSVGDKVNCAFNFGLFLECTTAGTTSAGTLDTRNVTHAQVITDGTCQWTVRTNVKSVNGNVPDASGNITVPTTDANTIKQVVLDTFFPVGSIYMDATGNVNPNNQFGGTWVKIENRFLLASGTKTVGATGGEETHTLTTDEMPSHRHTGSTNGGGRHTHFQYANVSTSASYSGDVLVTTRNYPVATARSSGSLESYTTVGSSTAASVGLTNEGGSAHSHSVAINNTGGGQAHNNMPPYEVVNIWKRTA